MLNDNIQKCYEKAKLDLSKYFTIDNMNYFFCNDYKYRSNIKCISKIPKQNITLTFLQVQIVEYRLACYMITHSPIPKGLSLKLTIIPSKKLRNLANPQERIIVLTTQDESNGSTNSIIGFYSEDEIFTEEDGIKVNDIDFNDDENTHTVTSYHDCSLQFDTTSLLLNTTYVKGLIINHQLPDCSEIQPDSSDEFTIDDIKGCDFKLNTEIQILFPKDSIN